MLSDDRFELKDCKMVMKRVLISHGLSDRDCSPTVLLGRTNDRLTVSFLPVYLVMQVK